MLNLVKFSNNDTRTTSLMRSDVAVDNFEQILHIVPGFEQVNTGRVNSIDLKLSLSSYVKLYINFCFV